MAEVSVERLIRQTRQYEFSDGLRDLQLAVLFAIGSLTVWLSLSPLWIEFLSYLVQVLGRGAVWLGMLLPLLAPLAAVGTLALMNMLRRRWLWRETGMIKSRWIVSRRVNLVSASILLGGLALGFYLRITGWADDLFVLRMLWTATGWSFGCTLAGVGVEIELSRYVWLGVFGGLLSTGILVAPLAFSEAALAFGFVWCLLLGASGTLTLRRALLSARTSR